MTRRNQKDLSCRDEDCSNIANRKTKNMKRFANYASPITSSNQRKVFTFKTELSEKLNKLLDSKKTKILTGNFIPTQSIIEAENIIFKGYRTDMVVKTWLKNNTSFKSMTELKSHFLGSTLKDLIEQFLDSKEQEIINGIFIPTPENILDSSKIIKSRFPRTKTLLDIISTWIKNNPKLPYRGLRDFKSKLLFSKTPSITLRGDNIHVFPVEARNIISKYILNVLLNNPLISNSDLVLLILKGLESREAWTEDMGLVLPAYLLAKIRDNKYFQHLVNLFTDIIQIVRLILEKSNFQEEIIAYRLANELIRKGLLSYSKHTIRQIVTQITDYLESEFTEILIQRSHRISPPDRTKYTYEYLKQLAKRKGGKLITSLSEYNELIKTHKPKDAHIRWKCKFNHDGFIAYPGEVERGRWWCPMCATGKYERILKWYLNNIFKDYFQTKFRKIKLSRVIKKYDKTNYSKKELENIQNLIRYGHYDAFTILSIKGQKLILSVEYNGRQHYEFPNHFHKTLDKYLLQKLNDRIKEKLSLDNDIILLEFPFYVDEYMRHPQKIQSFIIKQFKTLTNIRLPKIEQYDHRLTDF